jgi:FkbM family methyltransferase
MSVIYIDLGCSTGKALCDFLNGKSFLSELSKSCDKVYAFDPIRDPMWTDPKWKTLLAPGASIEWYECAVGIAQGHTWLSMNDNPEARTIVQANQNYEAAPIKQRVKVIDFLEWLEEHVRFEDTVIIRMDIAGAEYAIMERLVESKLMNRINYLFIEWNSSRIEEDKRSAYEMKEKEIKEVCPVPIQSYKAIAP